MAEDKIKRRVGRIRAKKEATMPEDRKHGKRRLLRATAACAIALMMVCILTFGAPASGGDLKVVRGIVGTVSGSHLFLDGKSIDLSGVTIQNHTGKEIPISEITPGTKVGLYYRRGILTSVLVYPPMVE